MEPRDPDHQETLMSYLPYFHAYGMLGLMLEQLYLGERIVILPRFEPTLFLESIQKYRVSQLDR